MRRVFGIALTASLLLALAGAIYQGIAARRESQRCPPPGRLVRLEGTRRSLHLLCAGEGQPTVIFEHSGLGNSLSSRLAREEVSTYTRTCSYDRMGMGWSDPGPAVITAGVLADDFERLAQQAGLPPPFLFVPSSIGGIVAELFARRHPQSVAGMVFLDAGNSLMVEAAVEKLTWMRVQSACLLPMAARLGVLRLFDPLHLGSGATPYHPEPMATLCGLARGARQTVLEFRQAPPLSPEIPLTVLVHDSPDGLFPPSLAAYGRQLDPQWMEWQQAFSRRSREGTWRVVPGSGHLIGNNQPHAVAAAVIEMLARIRR